MSWIHFHTAYALRPDTKSRLDRQAIEQLDSDAQLSSENDRLRIVCRNCQNRITRPSHRISVNGSHQHTFANPSGVVFQIGCFNPVKGCSMVSAPSSDFSWFAGSTWQITICNGCQVHLGWLFRNTSGQQFFGLILDRLSEISISE